MKRFILLSLLSAFFAINAFGAANSAGGNATPAKASARTGGQPVQQGVPSDATAGVCEKPVGYDVSGLFAYLRLHRELVFHGHGIAAIAGADQCGERCRAESAKPVVN